MKRANAKRRRHKEAKDKIQQKKVKEGGLLIVHTGKGKGKTTAAMGMVARCIGHGMNVGIVQFVKGSGRPANAPSWRRFPTRSRSQPWARGSPGKLRTEQRDISAANTAWSRAKDMISDPAFDLILLDEINIVLRNDYLNITDVVDFLSHKPADLHVICTGRNAKPDLIDAADLVTEMTEVKHHFRADFKAQAGIEF